MRQSFYVIHKSKLTLARKNKLSLLISAGDFKLLLPLAGGQKKLFRTKFSHRIWRKVCKKA